MSWPAQPAPYLELACEARRKNLKVLCLDIHRMTQYAEGSSAYSGGTGKDRVVARRKEWEALALMALKDAGLEPGQIYNPDGKGRRYLFDGLPTIIGLKQLELVAAYAEAAAVQAHIDANKDKS